MRNPLQIILLVASLLLGGATAQHAQAQTIRYVNAARPDNSGDGLTWAAAHQSLQAALAAAQSGDQIWVAQGTYKPTTSTTDREASFVMKENVEIYGGFTSGQTNLTDRNSNPATNNTILSGDINNDNALAGNSYHVILNYLNGLTAAAVLDGFTVTGGNGDGTGAQVYGGGMFCFDTSPTIIRCIFRGNAVSATDGLGGAVALQGGAQPVFTNCSFEDNTANGGGAISNEGGSEFRLTMINCSFIGNSARSKGGGIFNDLSDLNLVNCSFNNNSAQFDNHVIHLLDCNGTIINCVLFGNGGQNTIRQAGTATVTANHSLIEASETDYTDGGNNITTTINPFISTSSTELRPCSPAINTGSNAAYTAASGPATDLAGQPRIFPTNGTIDMGAYEYQSAAPTITAQIGGTTTIISGQTTNLTVTIGGGTSPYTVVYSNGSSNTTVNGYTNGANIPVSPTATTTYTLVSVTDANGCAATVTGTATVTVNQAPPTITSFNPTNGPVGTSVTITGTNLTGANAVTVNGIAGTNLTSNTATSLTFTVGAGSTTGTVSVTTPGGTATSATSFTVTRPPTALVLTPQSVAENTGTNAVVGTLSTTDPDVGNTFTYTLVSGAGSTDNALVNISTNQLRITASPDFEAKPTYVVRVRTTDNTSQFFEQAFTITVTNVNEAPNTPADANAATNTVAENAADGTAVGLTATATDPDAGTTLTYSLTNNAGGRFQINASTGVVTVANGALLDFEANTSHTITVQASDGSLTSTQTFSIAVTNVNEAPAISPQTFALDENSANGTVVGAVVASDPDAGTTLTYSITAGNTGGAFSFVGSSLRVAATAALDFETTPTFSLSVQVSDGALTSSATVTVNLNDVAEGPTGIGLSPQSIPENQPVNTAVGSLSATGPGAGYTYALVSGAGSGGNGSFSIVGSQLRTAAAFDFETQASYAIRVRATDNANATLFTEQAFTITVTNVNEAPAIANQTFSVDENSVNGSTVGTVIASDPDANTNLTYSITGGNTGGAFGFVGSSLQVANAAALDFETNPTFTLAVQVSDGTLTASATVTVNLNDLDEVRPTLSITSSASSPTTSSPIPLSFTFSESVTGFTANDVTVTGGTLGEFSGSSGSYSANVTPSAAGTVTVDVAANAAQDAATNGNAAAQFSIQYQLPVVLATVVTAAPTAVTTNSATLGGQVTSDGGGPVTERGVVYLAGSGTPTTGDTKVVIGSGTGSFSQNVTGLNPAATYSVRAYAINSAGTSYGATQSFTTCADITLAITGNTSVTFGYGSNCTTLTADASGGTAPYAYVWKDGDTQIGTQASQPLCPTATTTYTVTATNGCTGSRQVTVTVNDVRCGNQQQNVVICYYGTTQCVNEKTAERYLKLGATLGPCSTANTRISYELAGTQPALSLSAFPNPVQDAVTVEVVSPVAGEARFEVIDLTGLARQSRRENLVEGLNQVEFRLGTLSAGTYLIRCVDAAGRQAVVRINRQ